MKNDDFRQNTRNFPEYHSTRFPTTEGQLGVDLQVSPSFIKVPCGHNYCSQLPHQVHGVKKRTHDFF
jgi:hypothetical protein